MPPNVNNKAQFSQLFQCVSQV